jgi:uncharacterized protein YbaR (Trm112 family)
MPAPPAQIATLDAVQLEQFACPVCFGSLSLAASTQEILCVRCQRGYPVVDGIPVLIGDRAIPPKLKYFGDTEA